jgi:hypothetical protein
MYISALCTAQRRLDMTHPAAICKLTRTRGLVLHWRDRSSLHRSDYDNDTRFKLPWRSARPLSQHGQTLCLWRLLTGITGLHDCDAPVRPPPPPPHSLPLVLRFSHRNKRPSCPPSAAQHSRVIDNFLLKLSHETLDVNPRIYAATRARCRHGISI